jgi:uncharacterized protein YyaL (SSP411 family)
MTSFSFEVTTMTHRLRGLAVAAVMVAGLSSVLAQSDSGWFEFTPPAFRRALAEDRLVLLVLETPWAESCARARAEVWNSPEVTRAIRSGFVPIRARADLRPDLARRYPAEGWPGVSILLPDGSPLYLPGAEGAEPRRMTSGFLPPSQMARLLDECLAFYRGDRNKALEIAQQREAVIEKTLLPAAGEIGESAVWGLGDKLRATFDRERRYFGGPPRLPRFELIELMLLLGAEAEDPWRTIGLSSLDTLTKNLADEDGALRRMALGLDWEDPQPEKLLDRNARYLELLTLAWRETARRSYREQVVKTAKFIVDRLGREDGFFDASIAPAVPGGRDRTVLTGANGLAAAALIRAGAATDEPALIERGLAAARALRDQRWRAGRLVPRAVVGGEAVLTGYLEDQAQTATGFIAAYEVTGDRAWIDAAKDLAVTSVLNLAGKSGGALQDIIPQPGAPKPLRRAHFPLHSNMELVRVLVRLNYLADSGHFGRKAREILQAFAGSYEKVPLWVPNFVLAAYEFHFPPMTVGVVAKKDDPAASPLRRAALGAAFPFVLVGSFEHERDRESLVRMNLPTSGPAVAAANHATLATKPEADPAALRAVLAGLREQYVAQQREVKPEREYEMKPARGRKPPVAVPKEPAKPAGGDPQR